jgi:hypothetical protein
MEITTMAYAGIDSKLSTSQLTTEKILKLASIAPELLAPRPIPHFTQQGLTSKSDAIAEYFTSQPSDYVEELDQWIALNGLHCNPSLFVYVPCFNEDENIRNLYLQYKKQSLISSNGDGPIVCIVVNSPVPGMSARDECRFLSSIKELVTYANSCAWLHVVAKRFPKSVACLGRARKYGLDYCLRVAQVTQNPSAVIVANEGDTVWISDHYFEMHWRSLQDSRAVLSQGVISYPEFAQRPPALNVFLETREAVHHGQGLAVEKLPTFGGIMPVGRNFSVLAWAAAVVGGIDPTRRAGTDDDIVFGHQVSRRFGAKAKQFAEINIVTNPRREALIVDAICAGIDSDAKQSYENFHEDASIYDVKFVDLERCCARLATVPISDSLYAALCKQYFQWVYRSVMKEVIKEEYCYVNMSKKYDKHEIGYWDVENYIISVYSAHIIKQPCADQKQIACKHLQEAFSIFRMLCKNISAVPEILPAAWIPSGLVLE